MFRYVGRAVQMCLEQFAALRRSAPSPRACSHIARRATQSPRPSRRRTRQPRGPVGGEAEVHSSAAQSQLAGAREVELAKGRLEARVALQAGAQAGTQTQAQAEMQAQAQAQARPRERERELQRVWGEPPD